MKNNGYSFWTVAAAVFFFFGRPAAAGVPVAADSSVSSSSSDPQQMLDFDIAGYGSSGEKTWDVAGSTMDMVGDEVRIRDITANLYGQETMVLTADEGRFDKATGIVHLKENVRATTEEGAQLRTDSLDWSQKEQLITTGDTVHIKRDNMTASGIGVAAKSDLKTAQLMQDVIVTLDAKKSGGKNVVITCDGPMNLDYDKQVAVFEKNVVVEGDAEQGTLEADKMTVIFNAASKQMEKLIAQGHVRIQRGENISYSDTAVVTASDKKMVLTGRPRLVLVSEESAHASP